MIQNWTERSQVFIVALIISIVTIFLGWFFGGWLLTVGLIFTVFSIITVARHVWLSDKSSFLIRMAMIPIIGMALANSSFGLSIIANILLYFFPEFKIPIKEPDLVLSGVLVILTYIIFYFTDDKSKQNVTQKPIDKLVEDPTIKQKLESVCRGLEAQIRDIDRDTNWSNEYYTPLDAEVEMKTSKGIKRVIADLLAAVKQSNDRLFLLIGEPGSGKSVALRKLCLDLLKKSIKKEIPIYVNLKEWESDKDWSKTPPTWQDLEAFVKESLQNKDRHLADFFEKYYDVLDESGNLFFVLDSFDEIPQVLGTNANSKLITDLTKVCREFLVGAKQPRSRGILASREHRMPHEEYLDNCTILRVRPFTHEKIELTLRQAGKMGVDAVAQFFRSRPDLTPILRNPFMTSLLQSYLANNEDQLPQNQAELYADYIKKSIQQAQKRLGKESIPFEEIHEQAVNMAKAIFSTDSLQAPLEELRQIVVHPKFDDIVEVLRFTRITRGNSNSGNIFSFSHRRFYEYFVVCDWSNNPEFEAPIESIPTDSKWRDSLVLYCDIAPISKVKEIANYCFNEIINGADTHYKVKNCLRFLGEAFKNRSEGLADIKDGLGAFIIGKINTESDPVSVKIAVEALGILDKKYIDQGGILAFNLWDSYISDSALRSCRHLDSISEELENAIISVIDRRFAPNNLKPYEDYISRELHLKMTRKELLFSLSLSEAFQNIKLIFGWRKKEQVHYRIFLFLFLPTFLLNSWNILSLGIAPSGSNPSSLVDMLVIFLLLSFLYSAIWLVHKKIYFRSSKKIKISFLDAFKSKESDKSQYKYKIVSTILVGVGFILLQTIFNMQFTKTLFIMFISALGLLITSISLQFVRIAYLFSKSKSYYKKIDLSKIRKREYIYKVFNELKMEILREDFITYLESNIKEVSGKFPDGFLATGQGPLMSRLLHLEEKWREVEEKKLMNS